MARAGRFVPKRKGYLEALNGDDAITHCHSIGESICQTANMAGHGEYTVDSIHGKRRIHTRVSTADEKSFWRERHHKTLSTWADRHKG